MNSRYICKKNPVFKSSDLNLDRYFDMQWVLMKDLYVVTSKLKRFWRKIILKHFTMYTCLLFWLVYYFLCRISGLVIHVDKNFIRQWWIAAVSPAMRFHNFFSRQIWIIFDWKFLHHLSKLWDYLKSTF